MKGFYLVGGTALSLYQGFFDDVDLADWPELLIDPDLTWENIKKDIEESVLLFIKNFKQ